MGKKAVVHYGNDRFAVEDLQALLWENYNKDGIFAKKGNGWLVHEVRLSISSTNLPDH